MITRPTIKAKYHTEFVPGEGVFLLGENQKFVLEGQNIWSVISMIDGVKTTDEISAALQTLIPIQDVYAVFELLEREGHIQEADPGIPNFLAAFWSELNIDTRLLPSYLSKISVQIVALDGIDANPMAQIINSFGINTSSHPNALIVIVNDYLSPQLEAINQHCIVNNIPWIIMKPTGMNTWLGPIIIPGKTGCWQCLENRLRHNREVETFIEKKKGPIGPFPVSKARVWAIEQQSYCVAVIQLLRWLTTGSNENLESQILITDTLNLNFTKHKIVKRPQCPACGNSNLSGNTGLPIEFKQQNRSSESEGGDRSESPEFTFYRFSHHISPITGVVSNVSPSLWNGNGPLRVYVAGHNFALKNDTLYFLKDGLRTNSSGKGRTDSQARTSALCEALERYSGVFRGDEKRIKAKYNQIKNEAIHPNECMLFSKKQFQEREKWLQLNSRFQVVPLVFDENVEIEWSPVFSYTKKKIKYLPTSYLFYGYSFPQHQFYCWADSNGNAAGSTLEDACLQAFFEVIERDSVCLWWYNQVQRPKVDLESFNDPYIEELKQYYAKYNREFWVIDLTTDTCIPAFAAITRRTTGPTEDIIMGFGSHLNARTAIIRAITEMNQFIPAVLNPDVTSETNYNYNDWESLNWWKTATLKNQPYLLPNNEIKSLDHYPNELGNDILTQLDYCISLVEKLGHEVLILDQTRPDIGLNVVKVIIPGMRHFWARFAPGRLFEVPVKLGWVTTAKKEDELNPISMFL